MHVYDMQKVPTFSSYSSRKITVWLSSCGREKKNDVKYDVHYIILLFTWHPITHRSWELRCTAAQVAPSLCHPCNTVQPEWHRSSVQGWPHLHRHMTLNPDESWPLHIRTDGMQALAARNSTVWVCVCLFASLSERRRCAGQQAPPTAAVLAPMRQWEKSDCPSEINRVKQTCTHNIHTCLPQHVDCAEKAAE